MSRPPVASERFALTVSRQVRYTLTTPYRDDTTHIVLEPPDLMARLAAMVPKPRMQVGEYVMVRSYLKSKYTTLAEHMPAAHRKHMKWTPARLLKGLSYERSLSLPKGAVRVMETVGSVTDFRGN